MSEQQPPQKPGVTRIGKAYILAMVFVGVGALISRATADSSLMSAAFLAALVCAVIGTAWVISDARAKRKS